MTNEVCSCTWSIWKSCDKFGASARAHHPSGWLFEWSPREDSDMNLMDKNIFSQLWVMMVNLFIKVLGCFVVIFGASSGFWSQSIIIRDNLDMMHEQTLNLAHWLSKGFDLGWLCDALDNGVVPMFCLRRRTETMQDAELQRLGWCLDGLPCILLSHTTVDGGIVVGWYCGLHPTSVWKQKQLNCLQNASVNIFYNLGRSGIGIFGRRDPKKNTIIGTLVPLEVKSSLKRMPEDIAYPCLVSIWTCKF